jgi:DNA polymerase-3 subunit delta'
MDFDNWLSILGNANAQPMIYVEEAAELLRKLNLTARSAKFKVVVMWLPERLREEAANKLLKLVEEPFPDTIFLMTSDNPRKILPTIYSRTQRISVKRYDDAEVAAVLSSTLKIDSPTASALASTAEGSLSRALALAVSDKESQQFLDLFMELMRLAWQRKVGLLKAWSVKVAELGREGSMRFYDYCARMVRENFIMNLGVPQLNLLTPAEKSFSVKFSPFINERNVEGLIEVLDAALRDTMLNGNAKIISFDLAVKAILLIKK